MESLWKVTCDRRRDSFGWKLWRVSGMGLSKVARAGGRVGAVAWRAAREW